MASSVRRLLSVNDFVHDGSRLSEDAFAQRYPASVLVARLGVDERAPASGDGDPTRRHLDERLSLAPASAGRSGAPFPIGGSSVVLLLAKDSTRPFPERVGVGRARGTDIWLPFDDVSKYHAFFTLERGVAVSITDAGSTNGTFVGSERLPPRVARPLATGDIISFGRYAFLLASSQGFCRLLSELPASKTRWSNGRPA